MGATVGDRVRTERLLRGLTQEQLDGLAQVATRTVQRIEAGEVEAPRPSTLAKIAEALGIDPSKLLVGLSLKALTELTEACTCPDCAAPLVSRTFVPFEHGDGEYEFFECGSTRGWEYRPCPKGADFPALDDYELITHDDGEGGWACFARGLTDNARAVRLDHGHGPTEEEARRLVRWSYVAAKSGQDVADREVGMRWPGLA